MLRERKTFLFIAYVAKYIYIQVYRLPQKRTFKICWAFFVLKIMKILLSPLQVVVRSMQALKFQLLPNKDMWQWSEEFSMKGMNDNLFVLLLGLCDMQVCFVCVTVYIFSRSHKNTKRRVDLSISRSLSLSQTYSISITIHQAFSELVIIEESLPLKGVQNSLRHR